MIEHIGLKNKIFRGILVIVFSLLAVYLAIQSANLLKGVALVLDNNLNFTCDIKAVENQAVDNQIVDNSCPEEKDHIEIITLLLILVAVFLLFLKCTDIKFCEATKDFLKYNKESNTLANLSIVMASVFAVAFSVSGATATISINSTNSTNSTSYDDDIKQFMVTILDDFSLKMVPTKILILQKEKAVDKGDNLLYSFSFDEGDSKINKENLRWLIKLSNNIQQCFIINSRLRVHLTGHASSSGTEPRNVNLINKRIQEVKEVLLERRNKGIDISEFEKIVKSINPHNVDDYYQNLGVLDEVKGNENFEYSKYLAISNRKVIINLSNFEGCEHLFLNQ